MSLHEMDRSVRTATHRRWSKDVELPDRSSIEPFILEMGREAEGFSDRKVLKFVADLLNASYGQAFEVMTKLRAGEKESWAYVLSTFTHHFDLRRLRDLTEVSPFKGHAVVCVHTPFESGLGKVEMCGDVEGFLEAVLAGRKPKSYDFTACEPFHGGRILAVRTEAAKKGVRKSRDPMLATP